MMTSIIKKITFRIKKWMPLYLINGNHFNSSLYIPPNTQIIKSKLSPETELNTGVKLYGIETAGKVFIGNYSSLWGPEIVLHAGKGIIKIGKYCSIARNVSFYNFNHRIHHLSTYFINKNIFNDHQENDISTKGNIIIGNDVWIGVNSVILSGVTIGNGAIIGAGSVVTKDMPPYSISTGIPAKVVKYRFDDETIKEIEKINWWDWPIEKIKQNRDIFNKEIKKDFRIEPS